MLSLKAADERFKTRFEVIENGAGIFTGVIDEIPQNQVPAYIFSLPRRLLRVEKPLPLKTTMVIRTSGGTIYLVGDHGDSESTEGVVFRSYRLFEPTGKYSWQRPVRIVEPVTKLVQSESLQDMTPNTIWGSYEPTQEGFDREYHVSNETARFITNQPVRRQDRINGMDVVRVDQQLGLYIATLA